MNLALSLFMANRRHFGRSRTRQLKLYEVSGRHWYFDNGKISKSQDFWKQIESLMDRMKASPTDQSCGTSWKGCLMRGDRARESDGDEICRRLSGSRNRSHRGSRLIAFNEASDSMQVTLRSDLRWIRLVDGRRCARKPRVTVAVSV